MEKILKAIKKIKNGDNKEKNLNFIISRYYENIFKYTYNILTNEDDAFDVVQDIFLELEDKINKYDEQYNFSTFLYTIAYRNSINKLKKNRFWNKLLFWEDKYENKFKEEIDPLSQNSKLNEIKKEINKLNERERTLMYLKYELEMSSKEIANILEISQANVDVIHSRIIKKLKKEVKND